MLPLKSFHWGLSFSHTLIFSCVRLGCNLFPTELFFNGGAFNGVNMYYTVLLACFVRCTSYMFFSFVRYEQFNWSHLYG